MAKQEEGISREGVVKLEPKKACIYCGITEDLSDSDIIPDALTNAKIINPNVCRVAHNNKFSDMFEDYIIKQLAIITNELDIKSSKGKNYATYDASILIDNIEYVTRLSSDAELFRNNRIISTSDGKTKLGPLENIRKFKGATEDNVTIVDVNQAELEKRIKLKMDTFFSLEMHRLMSKIAFEWYCLHNGIHDKIAGFDTLIEFITTGKGTNPVSFISNIEIYAIFSQILAFGSHALFSYIGIDGSVNIVVSLFGLCAYNIRILDAPIVACKNNALFQELTIDAKRNQFFCETVEELTSDFSKSLHEVPMPNGLKIYIPHNMSDFSLQYKLWYMMNYQFFQTSLKCIKEPNQEAIELLKKQIEEILQSSALTIRGLKRFVKEQEYYLSQGNALNPKGTDKKATFLYYCLFVIGRSTDIHTFDDLSLHMKGKFSEGIISIDENTNRLLLNEIFATEDYFSLIKKGAEIVKAWKYI